MTKDKIRVAIVGASGYTGSELLRLTLQHPHLELVYLTSRQWAGRAVSDEFPALRGRCQLHFSDPNAVDLSDCDAVFFATPHGVCMQQAPRLLEAGVKVVDLSADFRIKNITLWEKWYGMPHQAPEYLQEAVYGLPEMNRTAIAQARLIACPGCYPTAVQLGLWPLLHAACVDERALIADVKSGISGAGREAKVANLFAETADSFKAYAASGHRHQPEIEEHLSLALHKTVELCFVPHLLPMIRGIEATLYAPLRDAQIETTALHALYTQAYAQETFVDVMPLGSHPSTRSVRGANVLRLALHRSVNQRVVIVSAVEDNLVKGAAGQALQCLNLQFGLPEHTGLSALPLIP